jgi:hypothetical protein
MLYPVPVGYRNTTQVIYCLLKMKNIAIWLYKEIALWPYHALLQDVRYPKTHFLGFPHVDIVAKLAIDTQSTPYPMI